MKKKEKKKIIPTGDMTSGNNRLVIFLIFAIIFVTNLIITGNIISGNGFNNIILQDIIIEFLFVSAILAITYFIIIKLGNKSISGYIAIAGAIAALFVLEYSFLGENSLKELFVINYMLIVLCIPYFNINISIFTVALILTSQSMVLILRPDTPEAYNIIIRYAVFITVGIGSTGGAIAVRRVLNTATEKHTEASRNVENFMQMSIAITNSLEILRTQSREQDTITTKLNDISQNQASSIEQIVATLEELASKSESITNIARSLFEELEITVESVNDLKDVNDKVQSSSLEINKTLSDVNAYSEKSSDFINLTRNKFHTLKIKSDEMSNFIQLINAEPRGESEQHYYEHSD